MKFKFLGMAINVGIAFALVFVAIGTVTAADIHVYPTDSIQSAVNNANPLDTIIIHPGTYTENVEVNKELIIRSYSGNPDNTIVKAASSNDYVFYLNADNVTISGLTITGADDAGIRAGEFRGSSGTSDNNTLINNIITGNGYGISLSYSSGNILDNNSILRNNISIYLGLYSDNNILSNNRVSDSIWLEMSSNNILSNNRVAADDYNYAGILLEFDSTNNTLRNNTILDNNHVINWDNISASGIYHGIKLESSSYNTLDNNTIINSSVHGITLDADYNKLNNNTIINSASSGIVIYDSVYNLLDNNTILSNGCGIFFNLDSSNNTLTNNMVSDNGDGISLNFLSDDNELIGNTITNNHRGIYVSESDDNIIYNNFFNNSVNTEFDTGSYNRDSDNIWNTELTENVNIVGGPYIAGNYWATPNGTGYSQTCNDSDGDGICDALYLINENNTDYLPLCSISSDSSVTPTIPTGTEDSSPSDSDEINSSTTDSDSNEEQGATESSTSSSSTDSDDINITLVSTFDTDGEANDVVVQDSYAYVADNDSGLVIIDVSDPGSPTLAGSFDTDGEANDVAVAGNYVYIADGINGLVIVDISNPESPALAGRYDIEDYAQGVDVSGNYAYVAGFWDGLVVVDVAEPTAPALAGKCYMYDSYANDIAVSGDFAYLTCSLHGSQGVDIIDISNPSSPSLEGYFYMGDDALGIAVEDNYAYIGSGRFKEEDFFIVDVNNPSSPSIEGSCNINAGYEIIYDVALSGDYAYMTNGHGFAVVDISDPSSTSIVGSYDTGSGSYDVAVDGDYVYVTNYYDGLIILRTELLDSTPDNEQDTAESSSSSSSSNSDMNNSSTIDSNSNEEQDAAKSSSSSSPSSSGGGGGTTGEKYENIAYKDVLSISVLAGSEISYDFDDENNAIEYIRFKALRNEGTISTTIEMLDDSSALADEDAPDNVYCNVNLWVGNSGFSENIEDSVVGFKVEREWIDQNDIDVDSIRLCRYADGQWDDLDTEKISEDETYLHLEARTPGFSPFAIVGTPIGESAQATTEEDVIQSSKSMVTEDAQLEETTAPNSPNSTFSNWILIGCVSVLLIGGYVAFAMHKKRG